MRIKLIVMLLGLLISSVACRRDESSDFRLTPANSESTVINDSNSGATSAPGSYADVVSRVAPAVVTIHARMRVRAPRQFPFMDDPFFREFFGQRRGAPVPPPEQRRVALGSGVIVSAEGHVVTNHHVIDGAEEVSVTLNDNRSVRATVIGSDPPSDLAVLKIDAGSVPVLTLGDSDRVQVGDVVLAIGNPLGIGQTVTLGIISAKGRRTGLSDGSFEDFLQTDAAINQGNSGGALVSTNSELVGINSQILSPSGGSIGIGFAIPSNMTRTVVENLVRHGKVSRGQLGIVVQNMTPEIAKSLNLSEARGVIITRVQPGSPAARAGLRQGDVIISLNGMEVNEPNAFRNQIASTAPGTEVTLTILRDGRQEQVRATLGEFVPQTPRRSR